MGASDFLGFFRNTPGGQTPQPIFTQNGSNNVDSRKYVPFALKVHKQCIAAGIVDATHFIINSCVGKWALCLYYENILDKKIIINNWDNWE